MKSLMLISCTVVSMLTAEVVWSPEIAVSRVDTIPSYLSYNTQRVIAVGDDGAIHVVWHEGRSPYPDVYWGVWYRSSYDTGNNWAAETCISFPLYYGTSVLDYANESPTVAMSAPAKVNVLWDGYDESYFNEFVFHFYSPDNGRTWEFGGNAQYWASDPPSGFNSICGDGANYLVFYDMQWVPQYTEYRLCGMASTDGGESWGGGANWHGWSTTGDGIPCTACDSNDVGYVVWSAVVGAGHLSVIMFGYAVGQEFEVVPHPGTGGRGDPFIESNLAGRLYLVWSDSRDGNSEIYFKKSTDGGATWSNDQRLTNASGNSTDPSIILGDAGEIFLAWVDTRDGNSEIYFKYSEDDGATWNYDTRLTNDPGACSSTHIAISPGKLNLYVAWNDTRDGQEEVYFKKGTIPVGISESAQMQKEHTFKISPNPFSEKCCLAFNSGPGASDTKLSIYDGAGRSVKHFNQLASTQSYVIWHGDDDSGRELPAGVYFVQLEAGDYQQTEKVILLR